MIIGLQSCKWMLIFSMLVLLGVTGMVYADDWEWDDNPLTRKESDKGLESLFNRKEKPSFTLRSEPNTEQRGKYLGELSENKYREDSISNPYGRYGNSYGETIKNPYGEYGSKYSQYSWKNPYTQEAPRIYGADGKYLGKLSSNKYDPESISNPYGLYGNPYGDNLVNPYSNYGSKYSSESWRSPYATDPPRIYGTTPYSSSRFGSSDKDSGLGFGFPGSSHDLNR